ncbi:MAG: hypothetical protein CMG71_08005 [Candidatus Marinimicrobia bacterium]|nr:hypothetical protein [Candidatus Neomarinimicrobiota bacterium]|tara:strand:- start:98 stop:1813 length:1716 start_codon:yes stop_codon:yes gene_type:complete
MAAEVQIRATVDQNQISLNETITLKVTAEESDGFPKLDLAGIKDFTVISGPGQSSSFQWINGNMSSSKTLSWTLIPNKVGTLTIPEMTVEVDGKLIPTAPIGVTVTQSTDPTAPGTRRQSPREQTDSPLIFLVAEPDKMEAFQGEQVTVHYKLYTRVNLRQYAVKSKPQGVGFWQEELFAPKQPTLRETSIDGVRYRVATLYKVALFPITNGDLVLEPMILNCSIEVPSRNRQFSLFNDFFSDPFFSKTKQQIVRSDELTFTVKPVPEAGKPAGFTGGVGTFDLKAHVDTTQIAVNQALAFTIELSGTGNLGLFQLPEPEFPGGLEVFNPKTTINKDPFRDQLTGNRSWEYILIPRREGQYIIPQVNLSFLEPSSGQWKTVSTEQIPIVVKPAEATLANGGGLTKEEISLLSQDIRYIRQEQVKLRNSSNRFIPAGFWYINLLAVALFLTPNVASRVQSGRDERRRLARRRGALRRARKNLSKIDDNDFASLQDTIHGYFSARLGLPAVGLDARILREKLAGKVDEETADELAEVLAQCGLSRFAQSVVGTSPPDLAERTKSLLREIDSQL